MKTPEELLNANLRLVNFILWRYFPAMAQDEDMIQEGTIGLWKACLSYDGRVKFSTFAAVCIRRAILTCLRKRKRQAFMVSLDAPFGDDPDSASLGDLIEDHKASAFEVDLWVADFTDRLKEQDRKIMELQTAGFTQAEIAQRVDLSQAHVSRRINGIKTLYRKTV